VLKCYQTISHIFWAKIRYFGDWLSSEPWVFGSSMKQLIFLEDLCHLSHRDNSTFNRRDIALHVLFVLVYIHNNCIENVKKHNQITPWSTTCSFSAIQEIPLILRNQEAHYRVHKSLPLVPPYKAHTGFQRIISHVTCRSSTWQAIFRGIW